MNFELTILGSSSAIPTSERYPTAHVLTVHERFFLIDCGEGTQIQLRKMKFSFAQIRHVFISHLHGDHFFGLPGFISTRNMLGITSDLHIYSHSTLKELLQPLIDHLKGELGFNIIFHPLNFRKSERIFTDKHAEVYSFPLKHSVPCCGFLFREKPPLANIIKDKITEYQIPVKQILAIKEGADFVTSEGEVIPNGELTIPPPRPRSYAFCTDTSFYPEAVEMIRDADLLYHEATFLNNMADWAAKTCHSTSAQAAEMARQANAGKLIIGHFSTRYKSVEPFLQEASELFPETYLAFDGARFSVEMRKRV